MKIKTPEEIIEKYLITDKSERSVITCYQVIHKDDAIEAIKAYHTQFEPLNFTTYCDKCNRIMAKKEVISLICMNPECENYIKQLK